MPGEKPTPSPHLAAWDAFAARRAGNPHLAADPLYALPEPLIDQIKLQIPDFFGPSGEEFERDLVRTAYGGFYLHAPFDCLLLEGPPEKRRSEMDDKIRKMLAGSMEEYGTSPRAVRSYFARQATLERDAASRRIAYSGWLVTNQQYLWERDALREIGEGLVAASGGFPHLSPSFMDEEPGSADPIRLRFRLFYRRWCLDRLITWDLPWPMGPELAGIHSHDPSDLGDAGVTLFVPWSLLRDKNLILSDLVEQWKIARNLSHLRGWLEPKTGGKGPLGGLRLANQLRLFRFRQLALASRYPLLGRVERLDIAFASFLGLEDPQSVRKLRMAAGWVAHP